MKTRSTFAVEFRRKLSGIDAKDVLARGMHVVAKRAAVQIARHIQRRPAAAEGIDDQVFLRRVTLEEIPDDVAGCGAFVPGRPWCVSP
jgi:hypothetical protein